jgi:hypothetical protein
VSKENSESDGISLPELDFSGLEFDFDELVASLPEVDWDKLRQDIDALLDAHSDA